ncbi:MAG: efflux RND transporter permease subunit [Gammaproteobacteria bacterium]|jgi:multidrug efflux pump|nr:efflux RND transporter permease subunit [Gammaproteobacteria bacterium]MBP6052459.1 efflux RND transporter permease subunit [Pseudomonadales bacterium]MBK7170664.1 efflux RND transporter permease subunit [Gammaproteobacteria bacterium]MBK7519335.1 efflux RND transporter permease subunit [Gammaproteobacteria bacterium]MBK7729928.1 efflux RND transporter permease subunit [Gammaproteobacteria bacterium]
MKFTDLFIRRPVLAIVVSCLLLMLGLQGAGQLSVRQFPDVEKSLVRVSTVYAGASARTVQGFVTEPLQRRIAAAEGVEYMTSRSDPGVSEIDVHVRLGEDTEKVMTAIIAKVGEARFELPREVEDPVITSSLGDDAMIYMAFLSEQMSIQQVYDYVARNIQPELSTLEGVGDAKIYSSRSFAMRVWLDPAKMAAFAVTATDVNRAIREQNYISAAGSTRGMLVRASIDAETDIQSPDQFAGIVVRQDGDQRVRLGDVADLELASADYDSADYSSGRDTVFLAVTPAPGANPLEVAGRVKEVVPRLTAQMPADLKVFYDSDSSVFIKEALVQVVRTLVEASLIVMLVILLFLGSLRVVLIPLVTIPLSLVGVLFLVWAAGFSINLLTLLAMVIAIGLVVDDAIVVVENVHRHIENGMQPVDAAIRGAREVALPVIAMTLTLAAVYAPITFLGGLTGVLFSEFALTLAGAVVVSGIIALTLSPMMCAYLLTDTAHQGALAHWLDARFEALHNAYRRLLGHCLDNRGAVLLFAAVILASLPLLFQMAQRELAPEEDNGSLFVVATPPDYSSVDYVNYFLDQMVSTWKQIPEVSHSWQVNNPGTVFGGIELKPWSERERSQKEIQTDLQAGFARISGLEIFTFSLISLPGADSGLPVNFVIASTADYKELDRVSDEVLAKARESGLFAFVNKTLRYSRPEVTVAIERDLAARLGISMEAIGETLQTMLGESEVNRFSMEGRSYKVIPQAHRGFRLTREALERYYVRTDGGDLVPLATVIRLDSRVEPNTLSQYQQLNSTTIQGMMMPPNTLGTGLEFLDRTLKEVAPVGFQVGYEGESRRFVQETTGFGALFAVSLTFIFLVLAAQFNSFRDPLVVLVAVPLSIFGATVPLALGWGTLNIYTQVGLLTLIGLISKHGILIVDFANHQLAEGMDRRGAVIEAAALRLRPILMTTFATVLGVLPLLLAFGAGANSRFAIGLVITSGMLVGTLFTLFVLPTFYLPFTRRLAAGSGAALPKLKPATQ